MIVDQGGSILAIDTDNGKVLFQSVDGKHQICDVKGWFAMGGVKVSSPKLAETFAFEVDGFSRDGLPVVQRYDGHLQGLGQPIPRAADGTFGTKAARALNEDVTANYGREGVLQ